MRDERKKQARSNKQTRQRNTALPRQSLFLITCYALRMYIIMYVGLRVPSTVPKEFNIGILNVQIGIVCDSAYVHVLSSLPPSLIAALHIQTEDRQLQDGAARSVPRQRGPPQTGQDKGH